MSASSAKSVPACASRRASSGQAPAANMRFSASGTSMMISPFSGFSVVLFLMTYERPAYPIQPATYRKPMPGFCGGEGRKGSATERRND